METLKPYPSETFTVNEKDEKFKQVISFKLNDIEYLICLTNKSLIKFIVSTKESFTLENENESY